MLHLNNDQKQQVLECLSQLREIELELQRAERAGLDMSSLRAEYEQINSLARGLHKEYVARRRTN